ncbi:unnamed protein product [Timema podura]|uniref:Uncharacterized protein n=1 Tax=Timema podura TaxID=61482 RepID=A0ABN7NR39_TIMPD|nr:unnamed protein product [Timema podura]
MSDGVELRKRQSLKYLGSVIKTQHSYIIHSVLVQDYARTRDIYFINENLRKEDKIRGNIAPHIEREENVNQKIVQSMLSQEDIVMDTEAEENVNRKIVLRMPSPEDIVSDMEAKENGDIVGLMERY